MASVVIGLILCFVAVILIIESRNLLIGESADKEKVSAIYEIVDADKDVFKLHKPLTMQMGPDEVLLALDVEFSKNLDSYHLTEVVSRLEKNIRAKFPDVNRIYIEARNLTGEVKDNNTDQQ